MWKAWDEFPCFLDSDLYFPSRDPAGAIKFLIVAAEKVKGGIWKILEFLAGGEIACFLGHSLWKGFTLAVCVF